MSLALPVILLNVNQCLAMVLVTAQFLIQAAHPASRHEAEGYRSSVIGGQAPIKWAGRAPSGQLPPMKVSYCNGKAAALNGAQDNAPLSKVTLARDVCRATE